MITRDMCSSHMNSATTSILLARVPGFFTNNDMRYFNSVQTASGCAKEATTPPGYRQSADRLRRTAK